jgi:hypothetical protein
MCAPLHIAETSALWDLRSGRGRSVPNGKIQRSALRQGWEHREARSLRLRLANDFPGNPLGIRTCTTEIIDLGPDERYQRAFRCAVGQKDDASANPIACLRRRSASRHPARRSSMERSYCHDRHNRRWAPAAGVAAAVIAGAIAVPRIARAAPEQVPDGSFDTGLGAWFAYNVTAGPVVTGGALCIDVPDATANPWDTAIVRNDLPVIAGQGYQLSFQAKASRSVVVNANLQHASGGFEAVIVGTTALTPEWQTFTYNATAQLGFADGQIVFQVGGRGALTVCIDNVSLQGGVTPPPYVPDTGPRVRVNQVGYLPFGPKGATLVTSAAAALPWQLRSSDGTVVRSGT